MATTSVWGAAASAARQRAATMRTSLLRSSWSRERFKSTTAAGDVANKIGTYLKALAAHDNDVPFYVALPSPTIDWSLADGRAIPIEERDPSEVTEIAGRLPDGTTARVRLVPEGSAAANYAFDVTPARLVTGLITERGVCAASRDGLRALFPERRARMAGE